MCPTVAANSDELGGCRVRILSPWDGILRTASGWLYPTAGHTNPAVALMAPMGTPHTGMSKLGTGCDGPHRQQRLLQNSIKSQRRMADDVSI